MDVLYIKSEPCRFANWCGIPSPKVYKSWFWSSHHETVYGLRRFLPPIEREKLGNIYHSVAYAYEDYLVGELSIIELVEYSRGTSPSGFSLLSKAVSPTTVGQTVLYRKW